MGQSHGVESRGERDIFSDSPEGCLTKIISFTSPRDACVLASISKTFESLANSDIVWETFLPQDYKSLVPRWQEFSTKKELYLALCDDPVLIDDGKKVCSGSTVKEMPPQHQVYLNYRADLRRNFVSHLNRALVSENINTFWDGDEEHKGLTVKESLKSIEESRIALAIFSPRYTESEWCIKELDMITDCTVKGSLVTIPIFYKVEPSKVKLLEGDFGYKFKRWADGNAMEEKWAAAFKFVSNMSGITVDGNSNESDMIDRIVTEVKRVLQQIPSEESQEDTRKYGIKQRLKRLWLEKASGKRCIILPAMDLYITWGDDLRYWHWYLIPEARFGRIAELIKVCWFEILGRINTHLLSPSTRYSAYIVFKKVDGCRGFKDIPIEAIIEEVGKEPSRRFICFDEAMSRRNIVKPEERKDGWMEVELGEFFTEGVLHNDEIDIRVLETEKLNWKHGLIILGIEIRPALFH